MQLYFIRHGQSANNALWERTGSSTGRVMDPELTEIGWQQAEHVARFLVRGRADITPAHSSDPQNVTGFGLTHLYASLMVRAVQTGAVIARATGLALHAWETIHEEGGIYLDDPTTGTRVGQPGSPRSYFTAQFPDFVLPEALGEAGWWNRDFESQEDRLARGRRFLAELLERHGETDDRVAIVSHGGFYNLFMLALLDRTSRDGPWFLMNNTAISRFDFVAGERGVIYHNRTDFLPAELIT